MGRAEAGAAQGAITQASGSHAMMMAAMQSQVHICPAACRGIHHCLWYHLMTARYVMLQSSSSVDALQQNFPQIKPVQFPAACFFLPGTSPPLLCISFPGFIVGATNYHCHHKGGGLKVVALQMMMTTLHLKHKAGLPWPPGHQQGLLHRALTQVHNRPHQQRRRKCPIIYAGCEF